MSDNKFEDTKKELKSYLLGQDEPLDKLCKNLKIADLGLVESDKPLMKVLLCGPSGTGKTESAKIIAEKYFGNRERNLIKINMGEYSSEMDVSKLVGASAGYIGYDDEPALIKQVRQYPNSVILFDEIEKAHKSVFKILLNILDEGEMRDNKGDRVSFKNAIIIFTSNLGFGKKEKDNIGFVKKSKEEVAKEISAGIKEEVENFFAPEFLGRLDDIIIFNRLNDSIAEELIERYRKEFCEIIENNITFTKKDITEIKEKANIEEFGARSLKKTVRDKLAEKI